MSAKAFKIGFGVIMGSANANRRVTKLMEIPIGSIAFPERVGLPIREARVAVGGEISPPRQTGFAMRHEEWSRRGGPARRQVRIEECADGTREEHLAWAVAFAVNAYRALGPGNVVDIDGQRLLTAKTAIIDQPEERAISRVRYFPQGRLDLLRVQRTSRPFPLRFPFDPIEERRGLPSLSAKPPGETPQGGQASIVGGRGK